MDVETVVRLVDELVFTRTGKHLDDLQESIFLGTLRDQTYSKIAENLDCSEGYIKDVGSQLWKLLSEILGEEVKKGNLRSAIERLQFTLVSNNFYKDIINSHIHTCNDHPTVSEVPESIKVKTSDINENITKSSVQIDLTEAPDLSAFYGRSEELETLKGWILEERSRVVAILGMSGIGKTALTVQLIPTIQDQFDYVIWQNLDLPLEDLLNNIIQFLDSSSLSDLPISSNVNAKLSHLMRILRQSRCLIILDKVEKILKNGKLAGHYKQEYENYSFFFQRISKFSHNSCILLNSWESPLDILELSRDHTPVRCLSLKGLGSAAQELLKDWKLFDQSTWDRLIEIYQGNPLYLQSVAALIQDLFQGKVVTFLDYDTIFLGEDCLTRLDKQFNRLSELEKRAIAYLCQQPNSISLSQLSQTLSIPHAELFQVIQSLIKRTWIEKIEQNSNVEFTVDSVVGRFVLLRTDNL